MNQILRFLLEVIALIAFGLFGYALAGPPFRVFLAIMFPLFFAAVWGVFAVRGDPSRSGKTVVSTPGWIRLILELFLFGSATWMMIYLGYRVTAIIYGIVVIIHYLLYYERLQWLLQRR